MGRYSPTVLPRAFDFGGIIDRALQGYLHGRGLRRERTEEREREEDRRLHRGRMRREDLSQPGAATLDEYLETELGAGRQPLTEQTLSRVGRASETDVDLEFRRPEPTTVTLPGGETRRFQERAPFTTETGVVIDPRRGREERGLAAYLDAQMLREPVGKPWEREGFETQPEYLDFVTGKSKAQAAGRPRSAAEMRPPITLNQALDAVRALYGKEDPNTGVWTYPPGWGPERLGEIARGLVRGEGFPAVPEPPLPVAKPIRVPPPGEDRGSGIGRVFRSIGEFFRGKGGEQERSTQPAPNAPAAPAAPARAAGAPEPPSDELPQPQALENLDLTPEQQANYEQLLEQGWAHDDAVDELAADEWDALVQGGMNPTEATRQVSQKYGRSEAR